MNLAQASDTIRMLYGSPLETLSHCLRGLLTASPGHRLLVCDFASIESRALNWEAGQEDILEIYRGHGKIYEFNAADIYGVEISKVTKDQRQVGKVAELAFGYQGGKGAFHNMSKTFGLTFTDAQAESFKNSWRKRHKMVVSYWYEAEDAATRAILNPGKKYEFGPRGREVAYLVKGSFLLCRLPSGGVLSYPYPSMKHIETRIGMKDVIHYKAASVGGKFEDQTTYGGSLVENITQALARDLLAEAMLRLDAAGYSIVSHVHDEIVCDEPIGVRSVSEMGEIMSQVPAWAKGLPLAVEGFESFRYRK